jgi:hypothetical protein
MTLYIKTVKAHNSIYDEYRFYKTDGELESTLSLKQCSAKKSNCLDCSSEIIDFHTHCFTDELAIKAVHSPKLGWEFPADGTLSCELRLMAENSVHKCVLLNMATRPNTMKHVNKFAIENNCADFISFGSVHPFSDNAVHEIERLYSIGIKGIKFHTGHQGFSLEDKQCIPVYKKIGELHMITVIHCGISAKSPLNQVFPKNVSNVIKYFNGAPFVCAHMGGINFCNEQLKILKELPVMVDTALMAERSTAEDLSNMVRELGADRVLFGSDLPWGHQKEAIELIKNSCLTKEEQSAILYKNACRLLGLSL